MSTEYELPCGEASMVDLVDDLPLPSELEPGGDADPDRPWAWRDHEADERPGDDDVPGGDPDDGPIDSPASFAAWERLGIVQRFLPSQADLDKSTGAHVE